MAYLFVALGLVFLFFGAEIMLRGAVGLARRLKISALVVSLTIVAFATSAPELVISILAAMDDAPVLAVSNVIGSNIANILLILGVTACLAAVPMHLPTMRFNGLMVLGSGLLIWIISFWSPLTFWIGLGLVGAMCLYVITAYQRAKSHPDEIAEEDDTLIALPIWKASLFLVLGIAGLIGGSQLLVDGALTIARDHQISERLIGLTLVAIGTSLPELATSLVAAFRKQVDVALGNALGSNISNTLLILGATSFVTDIQIPENMRHIDFPMMLATSALILLLILRRRPLGIGTGLLFLGLYVTYILFISF